YLMNDIKRESSVFMYEQIKLALKDMIEKDDIKEGSRLPTEKELGEQFGASRITVRRALKELENEGILEVVHGKGIFVKKLKLPIHILDLNGFTEGLSVLDNTFTKEVVSKEINTSDKFLTDKFNRTSPFKSVELMRFIKDSHGVFSIDFSYFPLDVYPNILNKLKDNVSTFKIIQDEYGIQFKNTQKNIEFLTPDLEIAKLFGISSIDPVIEINKLIYDINDIPVHYSNYYLLGSRVSLNINVNSFKQ